MNLKHHIATGCVVLILSILGSAYGSAVSETWPQAQVYTTGSWLSFGCRTLDTIEDYTVNTNNLELSKYGGWKARRVDPGTGFFRVEQIDGRWWAIDPEGYLYIHMALNSINLNDYTADEIYQLLPQYGFNGAGCWSDEDIFDSPLKEDTPLAYCPKFSFIAQYRRQRDPRIEMPVFDDAFETYCNAQADYFLPYVNDPHVFGYFSDNELPWRDEGLPAHVALTDHTDKNYITAVDFLTARGKTVDNWDTEDQYAYMALMAERYYSVVSAAIKAVDPNHLYIGSRCHSTEKRIQAFMENAGQYVDVFSMNHYNRWGARDVEIHNMSEWSGRPLMVAEFYAMEEYPGSNIGAGWLVSNQVSRGLFYQHYVSTLAETGDLVGWHWFKFQDADGVNKGVVSESGNLYTNLLNDMEQMNSQIYNFIDYVDSRKEPDEQLNPAADAYFKGTENHGADPDLLVKAASASVYRESYLRFDLSSLETNIASAEIRLKSVATGSESANYQAELVTNDTWGEMTITLDNNPPGSTVLATWSPGDDVEIDVTDILRDALADNQLLSVRIISTLNNGKIAEYGSREHTNTVARPMLYVDYALRPYEVWAEEKGLEKDLNDGYGDDPDADRMDNLLEYGLGGNPLTNDAAVLRPTYTVMAADGTNYLNYVYRRRVDPAAWELTYVVGSSSNLVDAPLTNLTEDAGAGALETGFESATNRIPAERDAAQFMQLSIGIE